MYKFLVIGDKNHRFLTVSVNEIPNNIKHARVAGPLEIICEVPLEDNYLAWFKEAFEALVFQLDHGSFLTRAYEFFVLGWNTAAKHHGHQELNMTVDELRRLVVAGKSDRASALANIIGFLDIRFDDEKTTITHLQLKGLLLGSFQAGFVVCSRPFLAHNN